jgi:hypothetical protein
MWVKIKIIVFGYMKPISNSTVPQFALAAEVIREEE